MVYIILSNKDTNHRKKIIEFVRDVIKNKGYEYSILFTEQHIIENKLSHIDNNNDIVLWEPIIAHDNLELMKTFRNSIVILSKPTVYLQKISKYNPINENMAINHSFFIIYIKPRSMDITNNDWKLVVKEEMYVMTREKLHKLIEMDENNFRKTEMNVPEVFDSIVDFTKDQINLSDV